MKILFDFHRPLVNAASGGPEKVIVQALQTLLIVRSSGETGFLWVDRYAKSGSDFELVGGS